MSGPPSPTSVPAEPSQGMMVRVLGAIERGGNKMPNPAILFVWLSVIVVIVSALMAVCVASSAAFLTPVATPANLMVMGPGGYRFGDYWKLGLPLLILFAAVAVLLVPLIWSF
jgi:di/tricarboxylate transporter